MQRPLMNTKQTKQNISNKPFDFARDKKVFVGLSGGVDSAVSAALLKQQGFQVTGVFIKVWSPDFLPCTWKDERRDAMRIAAQLDIPFLFFDFEKEYKEGVADYMISEYKNGRIPNPDVMCNKEIKFGAFWNKAKAMGADYLATGHYARNIKNSLYEGIDKEKDQSYFLWTLTNDDLSHILFPIGDFKKDAVRKLAKKFGLFVSEKKDSQGICFLGDVSLEDFLPHFIDIKPGLVLDRRGNVIGTHKGAIYYTIGERRGFEVTKKDNVNNIFYVVSKDMNQNTVTVSNNESEIKKLSPRKIAMINYNQIHTNLYKNITARIRYRGEKLKIKVSNTTVEFETPINALSLGQSIVFYSKDQCLGGAIINKILN